MGGGGGVLVVVIHLSCVKPIKLVLFGSKCSVHNPST